MILGSHNSWTYLKPRTWWMRLLWFTAKCQDEDIYSQYEKYNVRSFDLRVRFDNGKFVLSHGIIKYVISEDEVMEHLSWLNSKDDVYVRVVHEVRKEEDYTKERIENFVDFCKHVEAAFPRIKFWCGANLLKNQSVDYKFKNDPTCDEKYSSVCPPEIIDDWYPRLFAKLNNKSIKEAGTDKDILMIDFVNI